MSNDNQRIRWLILGFLFWIMVIRSGNMHKAIRSITGEECGVSMEDGYPQPVERYRFSKGNHKYHEFFAGDRQ